MIEHHETPGAVVPGGKSDEALMAQRDLQKATINLLEDFDAERNRLREAQRAVLNIFDDFSSEKSNMENVQKGVLNILEDFSAEKKRLEQTSRAIMNVLEDMLVEKNSLELAQKAAFNILEDISEEKKNLAQTNRAVLNFLEDLRIEKIRLEKITTDLIENKKMLEDAQRIAQLGNFEWDIDRDRLIKSKEAHRIFGCRDDEEATMEEFLEMIHAGDKPVVKKALELTLYMDKPFSMDYRIIRPDGKEKIMHSEIEVHKDVSGRPVRLRGIVQDITDLKNAMIRLEESERKYRNLVETSLVGIFNLTLNGKFIYMNEALAGIYGFDTVEEAIRAGGEIRFRNASDLERLMEPLKKYGRMESSEFEVVTKGDNEKYLLLSARLDGDIVAGMAIDITDRRRMEKEIRTFNLELERMVEERTEELRKAVEELAAINKELETFTYSVAHDLRAPLRLIDGFSMLLLKKQKEKIDATGQDQLNRLRLSVTRMNRLIDDLLNLSYVMRAEISYDTVDISSMASSIIEDLKNAEPERVVKFVSARGLMARADTRLVRMALENLIGNAWKYTSKTGHTVIEMGLFGVEDDKQVFYVKDNGVGFEMEYAEIIFEPFQRLHSADEFPGTGVGLATVRRIIERLGGRVWAKSEAGKGATFFFTLQKAF